MLPRACALLAGCAALAAAAPPRVDITSVLDLTHTARPVRRAVLRAGKQFNAGVQDIAFDLNKAALVIVDMQNFFLNTSDAPGVALVPATNAVSAAFRAAGAPVVYVNWGMRADYADWQGNWQPPVRGTHEAALYSGLTFDSERDYLLEKHRRTGFYKAQLDDVLRGLGARTLFFGGVNTDQCVYGSLSDADYLGYDAVMVRDLTATDSPQFAYDMALFNSPYTTTSKDILAAFAWAQ